MIKYIDFNYIPYKPSEKSVLLRLGYNKKVIATESEMHDINKAIEKASTFCFPKARCLYLGILSRTESSITLENGTELKSEKLARLLLNSDKALLMAATLGDEVTQKISYELSDGDKVFSVILDAYASQCVDGTLGYIMKFESQKLFRHGNRITRRRFSPGYGGLDIGYQRELFSTLNLEDLDMEITDSFLLIPEKSVIAIAGVEKITFNI